MPFTAVALVLSQGGPPLAVLTCLATVIVAAFAGTGSDRDSSGDGGPPSRPPSAGAARLDGVNGMDVLRLRAGVHLCSSVNSRRQTQGVAPRFPDRSVTMDAPDLLHHAHYIDGVTPLSRNSFVSPMDLSDLYSEKILEIAGNQPVPGRLASPSRRTPVSVLHRDWRRFHPASSS